MVTGSEMLQLIIVLEQMQKLRLNWLPVSLHHDGSALLVQEENLEEDTRRLIAAVKERLSPSRLQIKSLEFTDYPETRFSSETYELSDNLRTSDLLDTPYD